MIISRVHPILIRSSRTLKFIFAHKTQTSNSLNHSLLEVPFGKEPAGIKLITF